MKVSQEQARAQLRSVCRQWDFAIAENDVLAIGKFMAADWVIIGTEGGITSKDDFLKFIASGELVHTAMVFDDVRIVVYEKTAIVTSKGSSIGNYKGTPFHYYEWSTNVFVQNGEDWRCVLTMLTPAEK